MQTTILAVTLVLMAVVAFTFWKVAAAVNAETGPSNVGSKRSRLFWTLVVLGILVTVASLRPWPHAVAAGGGIVQVNATGGQWFWEIDTQKVPIGKKVVFNLHTKDVNHGFGVVDRTAVGGMVVGVGVDAGVGGDETAGAGPQEGEPS